MFLLATVNNSVDPLILKRLNENDPTLTTLCLNHQKLDAAGGKTLAEALKVNRSLLQLDLRSNDLGAETGKALAEALKVNRSLQQLDLSYNTRLGAETGKALTEALKVNRSLQQLNLNGNRLGPEAGKALAEALKVNRSLRLLYLGGNGIDAAGGGKALAEALKINHSLQQLDLSYNRIDAEGSKALAEALKINRSLQQLDLRSNDLDAEGGKALAEALKVNRSLQLLDLSGNSIDAEGGRALAEALKVNRSLQQLNLNGNRLGTADWKALAEALKVNRSLQQLNLNGNRLGTEAGKALAEALKVNRSLRLLYLGGNGIDAEGGKALAEALKVNRSLQQLDLSYNIIDAEGGRALAEALKINSVLDQLNLRVNGLNAEVGKVLGEALKVNRSLQQLNLNGNSLRAEGVEALAEALKVNETLIILDYNDGYISKDVAQAIDAKLEENKQCTDTKESILSCLQANDLALTELSLPQAEQGKEKGDIGEQAPTKQLEWIEALKQSRSVLRLQINGPELCFLQALRVNRTIHTVIIRQAIREVAEAEELMDILRENRSVTTLHLSRNQLGIGGATALANGLHALFLRTLAITCDPLGTVGGMSLATAVKNHSTLTEVRLEENRLGVRAAQQLSAVLKENRTLRVIALNDNPIGDEGAEAFAEALHMNQGLQELALNHCAIGKRGAEALAAALKRNHTLQQLSLDDNTLSEEVEQQIATALERNRSLEGEHTREEQRQLKRIKEATEKARLLPFDVIIETLFLNDPWLKVLDLSKGAKEELNPANVKELAAALKANHTVMLLDLHDNPIGPAGAEQLASALETNTTLTELDLWNTNIQDLGAAALVKILEDGENHSLRKIEIGRSSVGRENQARLESLLKRAARTKHGRSISTPSPVSASPTPQSPLSPASKEEVDRHHLERQISRLWKEMREGFAGVSKQVAGVSEKVDSVDEKVDHLVEAYNKGVLHFIEQNRERLNDLILAQEEQQKHDQRRLQVERDEALTLYHRYFERHLVGTCVACLSISSEKVANAEKEFADHVITGLTKLAAVAVGTTAATAATSPITLTRERTRWQQVQRIAAHCGNIDTLFQQIGRIALDVTLFQQQVIKKIPATPESLTKRLKQMGLDAWDLFRGNDTRHNPIGRQAIEDSKKLLKAMMESEPSVKLETLVQQVGLAPVPPCPSSKAPSKASSTKQGH